MVTTIKTTEQAWDMLIDMGVSEQTLQVVTSINGYSFNTMLDVLYATSGLRRFDQIEN